MVISPPWEKRRSHSPSFLFSVLLCLWLLLILTCCPTWEMWDEEEPFSLCSYLCYDVLVAPPHSHMLPYKRNVRWGGAILPLFWTHLILFSKYLFFIGHPKSFQCPGQYIGCGSIYLSVCHCHFTCQCVCVCLTVHVSCTLTCLCPCPVTCLCAHVRFHSLSFSVYFSMCPCLFSFLCVRVRLPVCVSVRLPVCVHVRLPVCVRGHLSVSVLVRWLVYVSMSI